MLFANPATIEHIPQHTVTDHCYKTGTRKRETAMKNEENSIYGKLIQ
jgi:hypothetical protein